MSQFMPETQATPQLPDFKPQVDSPTLSGDVALMQRIFSAAVANPSQIPSDFLAYVVDYIQTQRLNIPIGQVIGYSGTIPQLSDVQTAETTSSTSYTDLATVGPELDGLNDGIYLVYVGAYIAFGAGQTDAAGLVSPSINGAVPSDVNAAILGGGVTPSGTVQFSSSVGQWSLASIKTGAPNSIKAQYRAGLNTTTVQFQYRRLIVLKLGNL